MKIKYAAFVSTITFFTFLALTVVANAKPAERFIIKADATQNINLETDHYTVSLLNTWISSKDSFFKSLFSDKQKLIVSLNREAALVDGTTKLPIATLFENSDVGKTTEGAWGINLNLLDNVPGDADTTITIQLDFHKENRISEIFASAEDAKQSLPADLFTSPWYGYSKFVAGLVGKLFKTDKNSVPFYWSGNIKLGDVASGNILAGHYIVLIAPSSDAENVKNAIDGSKLQYDETHSQLLYNGKRLGDHSYAVLKVSKAMGFKVANLAISSPAAWAVLANQFIATPVGDATNADQLLALTRNIIKQLTTEIDLLKREPRLSNYDRTLALSSFATSAAADVKARCDQLHLADSACPAVELTNYAKRFNTDPTLTPGQKNSINAEILPTTKQLRVLKGIE